MKRAGSVEPMEKPESPLPELPGNLQQKQVHFFFLTIHVLNVNTHVYGYFHSDTFNMFTYLPTSFKSEEIECSEIILGIVCYIKTKLSLSQRMSGLLAKNKVYIFTPFFYKFVDIRKEMQYCQNNCMVDIFV